MFYWVTYSTSWHTWATMGAQQKKHSTRQRPEIFGVLSSPWCQWSPISWSPCCKEIYIFGTVSFPRWTPWLGLLVANHHWFLLIWFFLPLLCFLIWLFRMHTCFDVKRWSVIIDQSLSMNRSDMIYILWSKQVYIIILWHDLLRQPYLLQGSPWPGQGQPAKQLNRQMDPLWHDRDIEAKPWREILKQNNQQFIDIDDNEYFWQCIVPDGPINTNQNLNAKEIQKRQW